MSYCTIEEAWGTKPAAPPLPRRKKRRTDVRRKESAAAAARAAQDDDAPVEHYMLHDYNQVDEPDMNSSAYAYTEPTAPRPPHDAGEDRMEPSIDTYRGPAEQRGDAAGRSDYGMRAFSRDIATLPSHVSPDRRAPDRRAPDRRAAERTIEIDAALPPGATTYAPSGLDGSDGADGAPDGSSPDGAPDGSSPDGSPDGSASMPSSPSVSPDDDWVRNNLSYMTEQIGRLTTKVDRLGDGAGDGGRDESGGGGASPVADTVLFISTGVLSIFLLDLFLRAGQRIAIARTQ